MKVSHSHSVVVFSLAILLLFVFIGGTGAFLITGKPTVGKEDNGNIPLSLSPFPSGNYPLQLKAFYPTTIPSAPTTITHSATPSLFSSQQTNGAKLGWSSGYYPGWLETTYPPQSLPWKGLTYLIQFSIMSNSDGSLRTTAHSLTPTLMQSAVSEAHRHNVKILISIGGDDDNNFAGACSSSSRQTFIRNLVSLMQTYGYDRIDLDIERDFGYPAHSDYIACVQGLRSALDSIIPRPTLTMAADPDWQAYMASQVAHYVDQINLMSYGTAVSGIGTKLNNYTSRGIPKSKLGIGLGVGAGGIDNDAAHCDAKANYSVANGYGGIMEFVITEDMANHNGQTPCFDAIAHYL